MFFHKLQLIGQKWLLKCVVLSALSLFSVSLFSQNPDTIDIHVNELAKIEFNNGSVFYGKILHYNPLDSLVFTDSQNRKIRVPSEVVSKVVESLNIEKITQQPQEDKYRFFDKSWYVDLSVYLLTTENYPAGGVQLSAGHRFNQWLSLGGFIARDNYNPDYNEVLYPIGAELSGYFLDRGFAPFYKLNIGYGFMFNDREVFRNESNGGIMLMPTLGLRFTGYEYLNGYFTIGYRLQDARTVNDLGWGVKSTRIKNIFYKRLVIGVGLIL